MAENVGKKVAYLYTTDGAGIGFAKDYMAFMKRTYNVEPALRDADAGDRSRFPRASAQDQIPQPGGDRDRRPARCHRAHRPAVLRGRHPQSVRRVASSAASNAPVPELAGDAAVGLIFAAAFSCTDDRPIAKDFVKMVQTKYGVRCPDHDFSQAYETAQIIKLALRTPSLN